ncbi:MAG TPA: DUF1549 domain-containing protein, partial [Planctomycetota bacterium]|nr:DUF1549 domain-containing protein [Planctomycetota bacterium]
MLLRRATLLLCGIPAALAPLAGPGEPPAHDPRGLDPTDFVHAVLPVLQRQGCASAYCHGAATGQGGFKLSLFGGDPQADHAAITRALGGRRLDLLAPEASLLLAKPLRLVDHGGGKRLTEDSEQHALLRAWIAAGAPFAPEVPRRLVDLQVAPDGGRLVVTATFAAGGTTTTADVTALATFSSSAQDVATVDRAGRFAIVGPGEAHLFTRYAGATARVTVGRPFGDEVAVEGTAREGDLDALFAARLADLGLAPAPEAPPERIARRLWLDLVERPPTAFELQRFLEMPEGERIARAADALLATPEFAVAAARRLRAFFEVPEVEDAPPGARAAVVALHQRVRAAAEADEPLPDLTRDLLAHGGPFLARREDPRDRAELVARTMFGVRLGCARCHDHPDDRWRQRDHLAFAACFAPPPRGARAPSSLFDEHTGEPVVPRLLPLRGADEHGAGDLHAFVHSRAHDAFARAFANRVFAWLLGAGLVEPLDDHRETNPARHEAWLEALV